MKLKTILTTLLLLIVAGGAQAQSGNWSEDRYRDTQWGGDITSTAFVIENYAQLAQFAYLVNNGRDFSGKYVKLSPQGEFPYYTMYDHYWTPIGTADHPFRGTFDGNGISVNYLKINDSQATNQGLFGYIGAGGIVKNTTVRYSTIAAASQVGAIAGYNGGTMTNCVVIGSSPNGNTIGSITGTSYAGAIVGQNAGTMTSCYAIHVNIPAIGGASTGTDVSGQAERLWRITGDNVQASVGTPTGTTLNDIVFYNDGIHFNNTHYYKTGTQATVSYAQPGYDGAFSVSGTGASISDNVVTVGTSDVTVEVDWKGTGTVNDPYLICIPDQLTALAKRVNNGVSTYEGQFFRLENDLDYDGLTYTVIGDATHPFSGTFDANGNTIKYVHNSSTSSYVGLFGYNKGTIKNLSVHYGSFTGYEYVGVIAGYNEGTIENCRINGSSGALIGGSGTYQYYGGVTGYNNGTVRTTVCAANVRSGFDSNSELVSGYTVSCSGGIVGYNASNATVENCLYLGRELMGSTYVGAIAGKNDGTLSNNLYHQNGYTLGNGSGTSAEHIGTTVLGVGTAGQLTGADPNGAAKAKVVKLPEGGTYREPYGATISGEPTYVTENNPNDKPLSVYNNGLLFDDGYIGEIMDNAFYTTAATIELKATEVPENYEATFSTTSEGASFSGNTLTVGTDVTEILVNAHRVPDADSWLADGNRATSFSTTGENSITITNAAELALLAYKVNFEEEDYDGYTITIGADHIDLSAHDWEPIGYGLQSAMYGNGGFLGTFDGAVKPISGLKVNSSMGAGLFSVVPSDATVKNVILQSPQVQGEMYVGAIAGMCSGTIQNCHVSNGTVMAPSESDRVAGLGGIAGMCADGTIAGCTFMGGNIYPVITEAQGIGGIVGGITFQRTGATVKDNLFTGNITKVNGNTSVGAIAGVDGSYGGEYVNTITNNYYVNGLNQHATPNSELMGINGADVDGARLATESDEQPTNIGIVGTQYEWNGILPYTNGLYYNFKYYLSTIAPASMNITLSNSGDNSSLLSTYEGIKGTVTLGGRTFYKDGSWNTICLPFGISDVNYSPLCADDEIVELYQLTSADFDEGILTLNFESCFIEGDPYDPEDYGTTPLAAGQPYLIRWTNATTSTLENPVFENVTIEKTAPEEEGNTFGNSDEITFIGTFKGMSFDAANRSILFLGEGNKLYYPEANASIGACRAYFKLNGISAGEPEESNPIKSFVLNFGDDTETGIFDVRSKMEAGRGDGVIYNITGQLLNKPQRGINIINGKKVVIK